LTRAVKTFDPIYITITEEEEEKVDISKNDFDTFIQWLIDDGIKAKKSERLWKKTILKNLLHDDKMTLENYYDFLEYQEEKMKEKTESHIDTFDYFILIGKTIITQAGKQKIKTYIEADSMIHLFFEDGNDLLVQKSKIQESFAK